MTYIARNTRVMQHDAAGHGSDIGDAKTIFGDRFLKIIIGCEQGEDAARGAYNWWPLTLDGETIGELRDDACGLTVHLNSGVSV